MKEGADDAARICRAFNMASLALGLAFLYLPIAILVIYSFNASRLVTVWGGWSTRWYAALLGDEAMIDAAGVSLRIAFSRRPLATVLGTLAAIAWCGWAGSAAGSCSAAWSMRRW